MKRNFLFLVLGTLIAEQATADTVICKKGTFQPLDKSAKNSFFATLEKTRQVSDREFCIAEGYLGGVASPDEIKKFEEDTQQSIALHPIQKLPHASPSASDWIWKQKNSIWTGEVCERPLEKSQEDLLSSLKVVSSNIACESLGFSDIDSKQNPEKKINYMPEFKKKKTPEKAEETFNLVSACYCLSKTPIKGKPPVPEYIDTVSEFVKKDYINALVSTRLYEFSLSPNILSEEDKKSCASLSSNKELHNFIKEKLMIPTVIQSVFSPLNKETALTLYNLGKSTDTVSEDSKVPVVSPDAFNNFVKRWTCSLKGVSADPTQSSSKLHETVAFIQEIHKSRNIEVNGKKLAKVKHVTACNVAPLSPIEESYLEKMLSSQFGQGQETLLESISAKLKGKTITEEAFADAFKSIVSTHLNTQCKKSEDKLSKLGNENYSAVFSDPNLIDYLVAKNPQSKIEIQRLHCEMMQKKLNEAPETFLEEFCHYKKGDRLPPVGCQGVGDFLKANFNGKESIGSISSQANDAAQSVNSSQIISKIRSSGSSDYSGAASKVRVDKAATLSSVVKTASERFSNNKNETFKMDLDNYSLNKPSSSSSFAKQQNTFSGTGVNALTPSQNPTSGSLGNNDVKAYQGFNQEFTPNQDKAPTTQATQPNIVYENKGAVSGGGIPATPRPTSAPVISTNEVEKGTTPTSASSEKEEKKTSPTSEKKSEKLKIKDEDKEESKSEGPLASSLSNSSNHRQTPAPASSALKAPSFQEVSKNPVLIPEEAIKRYVEARKFEHNIVVKKDGFDMKTEGVSDMLPPETGLMLSAFRTGKIGDKAVTQITIGDEIKDLKTFEQTNTFHGAVVLLEDKKKKERYICRAFITDSKDGVEKLLPVNATAPSQDEMSGYKCTTEKKTQEVLPNITTVEKKEAQKALSSNERLYKAFVLDRIIKGSK